MIGNFTLLPDLTGTGRVVLSTQRRKRLLRGVRVNFVTVRTV
jgi:hypothetical protein